MLPSAASTARPPSTCLPSAGSQGAYPASRKPDYWEPGNYYIVQKAVPTFADNLTKVWGKHTLKFGAMASNTDNYQGNQSTNLQGALSIGGTPGDTISTTSPRAVRCQRLRRLQSGKMGSYNNTVNFLTGNLTNYQESNSSPLSDVAYQTIAVYADDQIKVNKQLSVQVGLRFEHIGWWYDRQGVGLAVFYANRVLPDFYAGKYCSRLLLARHRRLASSQRPGGPLRLSLAAPRPLL